MPEALESESVESVNDSLRAAFASMDDELQEVETEEVEASSPEEPEEVTEPEPQEADAEESEEVEASAEESAEESTEETAEAEEPAIKAPEHWPKQDQEIYNKFSAEHPDLAEWLMGRHKSMEGDYTRKSQEIAQYKKDFSDVAEILNPHRQLLQQRGMTPGLYLQQLIAQDINLARNPEQMIRGLAQKYNVNLGHQEVSEDQPQVDPNVQALMSEVNGLKQQLTQGQQSAQIQSTQAQIVQFIDAVNEDGSPAYPHVNEVLEDMVDLISVTKQKGQPVDLPQIYQKAVRLNSSISERESAAQKAAQALAAQEEARAKAAKAKKAAPRTKPSVGQPVTSGKSGDIRSMLESQF